MSNFSGPISHYSSFFCIHFHFVDFFWGWLCSYSLLVVCSLFILVRTCVRQTTLWRWSMRARSCGAPCSIMWASGTGFRRTSRPRNTMSFLPRRLLTVTSRASLTSLRLTASYRYQAQPCLISFSWISLYFMCQTLSPSQLARFTMWSLNILMLWFSRSGYSQARWWRCWCWTRFSKRVLRWATSTSLMRSSPPSLHIISSPRTHFTSTSTPPITSILTHLFLTLISFIT